MGADHQSVGCGSELRVSRSHHYLAVAQSHRSMGLIFPGPIDEGVVVGFEAPMREPVRIASTRHERDVAGARSAPRSSGDRTQQSLPAADGRWILVISPDQSALACAKSTPDSLALAASAGARIRALEQATSVGMVSGRHP